LRHIVRMAVKFISCLVVLGIILGLFFNFSFTDVLLITTVLGVVSYLLGDLLLLRATNNFIASAADFGLTFLLIWFMGQALTFEPNLFTAALLSAVAVTAFEFLFHRFLINDNSQQSTNQQTPYQNRLQYQTEAADELTPVKPDVRTPNKDNE
jgi:hypothetical protein